MSDLREAVKSIETDLAVQLFGEDVDAREAVEGFVRGFYGPADLTARLTWHRAEAFKRARAVIAAYRQESGDDEHAEPLGIA